MKGKHTLTQQSIGEKWKSLPEHEKQPYIDMAKLDARQLAKEKAPRLRNPRKVFMQNRIALSSVANLLRSLTKEQCEAIKITEVQRLLGIHGCDPDIMLAGFSDEGFKKLCGDLKVNKGSLTLKDLGVSLGECNDVTLEFKRKFVLYMLGSFLCPTSQPYIPQNYVHVVRDVDTLNGCN
ncbi:hypothetical protein Vadar_016047 [Vaccinium darrowii]|uniref:Uncharacterized protein n=1 Tax=Vaccinium darrowii TaxID=229202 RepID=A0ACB7XHS5_9ERIC|nr:hypothetical protein Vadar_016047 [Vaccinium darrowii]